MSGKSSARSVVYGLSVIVFFEIFDYRFHNSPFLNDFIIRRCILYYWLLGNFIDAAFRLLLINKFDVEFEWNIVTRFWMKEFGDFWGLVVFKIVWTISIFYIDAIAPDRVLILTFMLLLWFNVIINLNRILLIGVESR